ncbi:MAG TPA: hypothetical protein VE953_09080 [Terriglobales bacterium]|nr:hypothetical protein [Terriglobales bacterium]
MTDDERRRWLAGLRPGDRVAFTRGPLSIRGCELLVREKRPYPFAPDDPLWTVGADADAEDGIEEQLTLIQESRLVPLPYPGMTGTAYVGPSMAPRRRARPKAKTASA